MSPDLRVVFVYDPNSFNSYGAELASVLVSGGYRVVRLSHRSASVGTVGGVDLTVFGSFHIIKLFAVAARMIMARKPALVVAWAPSRTHVSIVRVLSRLSHRVFVVNHNPRSGRSNSSNAASFKALLASRFVTEVRHVSGARRNSVNEVYHPSYRRFMDSTAGALVDAQGIRYDALFFGTARADKGVSFLPGIARRLKQAEKQLAIRVGRCSQDEAEFLRSIVDADVFVGETVHVSNEQLARVLAECAAVVAPYSEVTTSGSAIMAVTYGKPVLLLRSESMEWLLPDSMYVSIDDLTQALCDGILSQPALSASEIDELCLSSWRDVLV